MPQRKPKRAVFRRVKGKPVLGVQVKFVNLVVAALRTKNPARFLLSRGVTYKTMLSQGLDAKALLKNFPFRELSLLGVPAGELLKARVPIKRLPKAGFSKQQIRHAVRARKQK